MASGNDLDVDDVDVEKSRAHAYASVPAMPRIIYCKLYLLYYC